MVASFVVKFFFEEGKHLGTKQEQRSTVNETLGRREATPKDPINRMATRQRPPQQRRRIGDGGWNLAGRGRVDPGEEEAWLPG